jgi:hypothetical protein
MPDRPLIYAGLAVFVGLITFPIWYNRVAGTTSAAPVLQKPVKGDRCIYPAEFMRASHMNVLMDWRDQVVRSNNRLVTAGGRTYTMSLTGTCMDCHASKADFCDKCHNYAGVKPYCWDCHIDPALLKGRGAPQAAFLREGGPHVD